MRDKVYELMQAPPPSRITFEGLKPLSVVFHVSKKFSPAWVPEWIPGSHKRIPFTLSEIEMAKDELDGFKKIFMDTVNHMDENGVRHRARMLPVKLVMDCTKVQNAFAQALDENEEMTLEA